MMVHLKLEKRVGFDSNGNRNDGEEKNDGKKIVCSEKLWLFGVWVWLGPAGAFDQMKEFELQDENHIKESKGKSKSKKIAKGKA